MEVRALSGPQEGEHHMFHPDLPIPLRTEEVRRDHSKYFATELEMRPEDLI